MFTLVSYGALMAEPTDDQRAARLDQALAETQRRERVEQQIDMDRQQQSDEEIVEALARDVSDK